MIDQMIRCFVNPACCRVLMALIDKGRATAGQLQETVSDIPVASLYRYLKQLDEAGVIQVVEEKRVRGAVQRIYAPRADMGEEGSRLLRENPGPTLMAMYSQFSMQLMHQFAAYCRKGEIDLENDGFSFTVCPVCVSAQELREAMTQIGQVFSGLMRQKMAPGRHLHSIAVITTQPQEG